MLRRILILQKKSRST